jgi:hypothetical protein
MVTASSGRIHVWGHRMAETVAVALPIITLAVGVWCGIHIERRRRDRALDDLLDQ